MYQLIFPLMEYKGSTLQYGEQWAKRIQTSQMGQNDLNPPYETQLIKKGQNFLNWKNGANWLIHWHTISKNKSKPPTCSKTDQPHRVGTVVHNSSKPHNGVQ